MGWTIHHGAWDFQIFNFLFKISRFQLFNFLKISRFQLFNCFKISTFQFSKDFSFSIFSRFQILSLEWTSICPHLHFVSCLLHLYFKSQNQFVFPNRKLLFYIYISKANVSCLYVCSFAFPKRKQLFYIYISNLKSQLFVCLCVCISQKESNFSISIFQKWKSGVCLFIFSKKQAVLLHLYFKSQSLLVPFVCLVAFPKSKLLFYIYISKLKVSCLHVWFQCPKVIYILKVSCLFTDISSK